MWAIRLLNGNQAGQIFQLKPGRNVIGRGAHCDIKVDHGGVSKQHAEITVYDDKIIIADLNSRNGTFINGIRVQSSMINVGDKIGLFELLTDIFPMPAQAQVPATLSANAALPNSTQVPQIPSHPPMQADGTAAVDLYQMSASEGDPGEVQESGEAPKLSLVDRAKNYVEEVALPGVYKLPEVTDFRVVIGGLLFIVVFSVTALSVIPMMQITRSSIQRESKRRALSLARGLANQNQIALSQGMETSLSTNQVSMEEGVTNALIIRKSNGTIVAPAKLSGESPNLPFVATARQDERELVKMIGVSKIGASVPISFYDSEVGSYRIKYHAVVLYDMGALAIDKGKTTSLFIQTFVLALLVGSVIFFFLMKLIEHPFARLNKALDSAIQQGQESIEIEFQLEPYQKLISNINTMLNRALYGDSTQQMGSVNKETEAENLIQLVGFPALAVNKDGYIIGANMQFENFINKSSAEMQNQTIQSIPDQALQLSIGDLIDRSSKQPDLISSNELDFSGETFLISCQAIVSEDSEIQYTVLTVSPLVQEEYE